MKVENPETSTGGAPLACGIIIGGEAQLEHEHLDVSYEITHNSHPKEPRG
jgi:hypothetical protein